jgi:hypothetical protein
MGLTRIYDGIPSGYLRYPWKISILLIGKPSISMVLRPIFAVYTLWLFNIAMENSPFIDDVPLKPPFIDGIFHGYVK